MTWVRLEDNFPWHPKVAGLSDSAFRVHITAICYCASHLTNGHVADGWRRYIGWRPRDVADLVNAHLWEPADDGGYLIHDYLAYNPSRDQVLAEREEIHRRKVEAGRIGGIRSGEARRSRTEAPCLPSASILLEANGKQNEAPSRPVPSPSDSLRSSSADAPRSRKSSKPLPLTPEERQKLVDDFGRTFPDLDDRILEALNHKALDNAKTEYLYLRGWLRRDAERKGPPVGPSRNGHPVGREEWGGRPYDPEMNGAKLLGRVK